MYKVVYASIAVYLLVVIFGYILPSSQWFRASAQETVPTPTYGVPDNVVPVDPSDIITHDYEPEHPSCPGDGEVLLTFGTYHMIQGEPDIEEGYLFEIQIPEDFIARPGTVEVLQGEGHNWDEDCRTIQGPRDDWDELPNICRNFQPEETVNIYWGETRGNLQYIGGFEDKSPGAGNNPDDIDNITTAYAFDVPLIRPGINYLHLIQPRPRFPIPNSVFIKGTFCASALPSNTDLSPSPVPTFVYDPDVPGPDQKDDTDSRFHDEKSVENDQPQTSNPDREDDSDGSDSSDDTTDSSSDENDADTEESRSDDNGDTDDQRMAYASTESLVDVGENPFPYTVIGIILLGVLFFF